MFVLGIGKTLRLGPSLSLFFNKRAEGKSVPRRYTLLKNNKEIIKCLWNIQTLNRLRDLKEHCALQPEIATAGTNRKRVRPIGTDPGLAKDVPHR